MKIDPSTPNRKLGLQVPKRRIESVFHGGLGVMTAFALSACLSAGGGGGSDGGGSGGSQSSGISGTGSEVAGISGTGDQLGTVNGFGSVIVNGVRFDTSEAIIFIEGEQGDETDLVSGMVVRVAGEIIGEFDGVADVIDFDGTLRGPVESIDYDTGEIVAVGQTIRTDLSTVFQDTALRNIVTGEVITVSGYTSPGGLIDASFIRKRPEATLQDVDVEGFVSGLNRNNNFFSIGNVVVDFNNATVDDSNGQIEGGAIVEVKGTQTAPGAVLFADEVLVLGTTPVEENEKLNIEGIVNRFFNIQDFRIGNQRVKLPPGVSIDKDLTDTQPGDGVRLHVQGSIDANDKLVGDLFYVIPRNEYRIVTNIDFAPPNGRQIGLFGDTTRFLFVSLFEDNSVENKLDYNADDLVIGDYIAITGYRGNVTTPGGLPDIVAAKIERRDDPGTSEVLGPVDSFDALAQQIVIADITINADCDDLLVTCEDRNGAVVGNAGFYADLQNGDSLQTLGPEQSNELNATTVRFH